jgi:uncharacterized protein (DUF983 family)
MGALQAILRQRCPRCRRGHIFARPLLRGWLAMHERCPVCALKFEREQGYFLGAMYVSYALSIPPVFVLILALWLLAGLRFEVALFGASAAYLPFVPLVVRISRVVWIHIDQRIDPE